MRRSASRATPSAIPCEPAAPVLAAVRGDDDQPRSPSTTRLRRAGRRTATSSPAAQRSASMPVLPVTKICSTGMFSRTRFCEVRRGRREVEAGDLRDQLAVQLLRERRQVEAAGAQAGLDVDDRDPQVERGQRRRHRRAGVAVDEHRGGNLAAEDLLVAWRVAAGRRTTRRQKSSKRRITDATRSFSCARASPTQSVDVGRRSRRARRSPATIWWCWPVETTTGAKELALAQREDDRDELDRLRAACRRRPGSPAPCAAAARAARGISRRRRRDAAARRARGRSWTADVPASRRRPPSAAQRSARRRSTSGSLCSCVQASRAFGERAGIVRMDRTQPLTL